MSIHTPRPYSPLLVVLCAALCAGCSSGKSKPTGSISAAASATTHPLRAVAFPSELLDSYPVRSEVTVLVSDASLANPRLLVDRGAGFVDSGATPDLIYPGLLTFQVSAGPLRYRVAGERSGVPVETNTITAELNAPFVSLPAITEPAGYYGAAGDPTVTAAPRAAWGLTSQADRYLVVLQRYQKRARPLGLSGANLPEPEWIAEVSTTQYAFGDPAQQTYVAGLAPLPPAIYLLTVISLDSTGWGFATSNIQQPAANALWSFAVR